MSHPSLRRFTRLAAGIAVAALTLSACGGGSSGTVTPPPAPTTVGVPNVVGASQSSATSSITGVGLAVGATSMQTSTTVAAGDVISESPAAGTQADKGSAVSLVISSGAVLAGTVAAGAAVANGPGYALDAVTGKTLPFVTNASGGYSVSVFGFQGPFLLHVLAQSSGNSPVNIYSLASIADAGNTINVTPLSDVVLAYAAGVTTQNLESACTSDQSACPALLNGILAKLSAANTSVISAIPASVLSAFGLTASSLNAETTQFEANHTGVDGLLDALSVVPPSSTGGSYSITLQGAAPIVVATVPTSGTAGTQGGAPTAGAAPTSAAITQAKNLAAVAGEMQGFFAQVTKLFATATPSASAVQALMAPGFLHDGLTAAQQAAQAVSANGAAVGTQFTGGSVAPYSAAPFTGATPAAAVTYDANNCPTSVWVYSSLNANFEQLVDTVPTSNTAGVCTGGTWLWAGNGRTYNSELTAHFYAGGPGVMQLSTQTSQTTGNPSATAPYTYVFVYGPGLTTVSAPNATSAYGVALMAFNPPTPPAVLGPQNMLADFDPNTYAITPDAYYAGSSSLQACSVVLAANPNANPNTPCFNTGVLAGSDYQVTFYDQGGNQLGGIQQSRFPIALATTSLPASFYPTVTSVTPASTAVSTSAATNVVTTWTLPAGGINDAQGITLSASNGTLLFSLEHNVSPTVLTYTITVPAGALGAPAASGYAHIGILIGGYHVGAGKAF